jgi:nucleoside-diphosphate-sugar epimerase
MADRPRIVVTGASGFLGRRLVGALLPRARVVGIDLLPRAEAYIPDHENLEWHQVDLADEPGVGEVFEQIRLRGGVDAVVHLAAFYDFSGEDHPEYQRTNIDATRIVLDACRPLGLRRFVFASSVAACAVTKKRSSITEDTPPDGDHIYAATKRIGEAMLRERQADIPSAIVRLGAMYSDWCEYPPLHAFLETWLSESWNARVLGGRGESSIPFLHVRDGVSFFLRVLEKMDVLDRTEVLIASTDGSFTHKQLFETATAYYYGQARKPRFVPARLARPGMAIYDLAGRLMGERPFERPWMARYIDTHLWVDASRTRRKLGWEPHPRLGILKRIPFMIENRRMDPMEWLRRNMEAMEHLYLRPNYRVYRLIGRHQAAIEATFEKIFEGPAPDPMLLRTLMEAARTGSKGPFMIYCRTLAEHRMRDGFTADYVQRGMQALQRACLDVLGRDPEALGLERAIHNYVTTTIEFGADQVFEVLEEHQGGF